MTDQSRARIGRGLDFNPSPQGFESPRALHFTEFTDVDLKIFLNAGHLRRGKSFFLPMFAGGTIPHKEHFMSQALKSDQPQALTYDQHTRFRRLRFLKIKIKTLATEAKDIKSEMGRTKSRRTKDELREHQMSTVRPECRHSLLAYGFLRGKMRKEIESGMKTFRPPGHKSDIPMNSPNRERALKIAIRFSEADDVWGHNPLKDAMTADFGAWWSA